MTLSSYHQKYVDKSDEELATRASVKDKELQQIFDHAELDTNSDIIRVAVMGCGDKRFVKYHKAYFGKYTGKPVELTIFDITVDHLMGEENVVQHDCILPLPNSPYDITYAHVVLKFIPTKKQWDLIKNSYDALKPGGLAIHVLDEEDYSGEQSSEGLHSVPLEKLKKQLKENNIKFFELLLKTGPDMQTNALALMLKKNL